MSRGPVELMQELRDLFAANTAVATFCTDEFSKSLSIIQGVDEEDQPKEAQCPVLALRPGPFQLSDDRTNRPVSVAFSLVIVKEAQDNEGHSLMLPGLILIQRLYFLIEAVIETWAELIYRKQVTYGAAQQNSSWPRFLITWTITAQEDA